MENKSVLQSINSYPDHARDAINNLYHGKVYAVSSKFNKHVERFFKTKRGAEGYIKRSQSVSWYDDYTQKMVSGGSGLTITEVHAEQIENPSTSKKLWYHYLKSINGHDYLYKNCLYFLKSLNVTDDIKNYVTVAIEDMKQFKGLTVIEEYEEREPKQEITEEPKQANKSESINNNESDNTITASYTLNDDKNGIEISFSGKPSEQTREQLKSFGFRWSKYQKIWYAKQSDERLQFAKTLCNESDNDDNSEQTSQRAENAYNSFDHPSIEIEDIETYTISEELRNREHDSSWVFRNNKRDLTGEIQAYLQQFNDKVKTILETTDNEPIQYHLKKQLQSFKKRYYNNYVKRLENRANNPSWAVTGRAGRNRRKDEKANNRFDNLMRESIELEDWIKSKMKGAERRIRQDKDQRLKESIKNQSIDIDFTTKKQTIITYGQEWTVRTYNHKNYMIAKTWASYGIYKDGKEVYRMKTTDKLDDAKKYVALLVSQDSENKQQETA